MRSTTELKQYRILASNSPIPIGQVQDVYFDDESWTIRFFLVETGTWLSKRRVLLPVQAIREADWSQHLLRASITQQQIEDSPRIGGTRFSREHERDCLSHYGYHLYWQRLRATAAPESATAERHLRSARDVIGYRVLATDGNVGNLNAILVDDGSWLIRVLLVNITRWTISRNVEVAPEWIKRIDWLGGSMDVDLTREQVRDARRHSGAAASA